MKIITLFLPGLMACASDCPPGSAPQDDGLCHLIDDATSTSDDTATGTDTGSADWFELPASCTPTGGGVDPISLVGELRVQDHAFAEMVDIEVGDGIAWTAGQGGLMTLDISDPTHPGFLSVAAAPGFPDRFHKLERGEDGLIYATHHDIGMAVLDLSDPTAPWTVSTWLETNLSGMARDGDRLYVTTHTGELITFDLSTPTEPVEIARLDGLGNPWEPKLQGDRLYVADNTLGVAVVDISNRDAPALVGASEAAGGVQDLSFSADGTALYAAVGGAGVEVFSLADPDAPLSLGATSLHYSVIGVEAEGDRLWAVDQQDLVVLDISSPLEPLVINTEHTEQWAMHVAARDGLAYVTDWAWLRVYEADLSAHAPDADPSSGQVYMDAAGGELDVELANLGSEVLSLEGAAVDDARVSLRADRLEVEPGERAILRLSYTGGEGLDARICLATNDPDEGEQTIEVLSATDGGVTGVGSEAPDFSLTGLDGLTYSLSEQRGHPVVLVYFATW